MMTVCPSYGKHFDFTVFLVTNSENLNYTPALRMTLNVELYEIRTIS